MLVASRQLFQLSHCFDGEQTRLLQCLLHSVSPTALGTHWIVLVSTGPGLRDSDHLPLPYLVLDEGWSFVVRTGTKTASIVGFLVQTKTLGGGDTQVWNPLDWSWLTEGLGSTGCLFTVMQHGELHAHSKLAKLVHGLSIPESLLI